MYVTSIYDERMNQINHHFTAKKPTFMQLVDFKNRYSNSEYVEVVERFADFELREGERKERLANEEKQVELERIKREQDVSRGLTEGGTN